MLEGNKFLPETGIPMRKIACMRRPLALAEPVPLTLASLSANSLTWSCCLFCCCTFLPRVRKDELELFHVPGRRRAPLCAQAAVHADVLVLHHHPPGLRQGRRNVDRLLGVDRRDGEALAQLR